MPWIALLASFGLSLALIPLVRRLSFRWGKVAQPRKDRWHSKPTPTLGGIAIYFAFSAGIFLSAALRQDWAEVHWGLFAGSTVMFLLGLYDDFKRISPPAKLVGQILAAAVVIFFGYRTNFFSPYISNPYIAQIPNNLLTFLWLVGITNAINLLDNMDGLAGGIALITAIVQSVLFFRSGDDLLFMSVALAGSILGFLVFNFPPASIFMGDSGSLFLGFTLASLAIARQPQASNVFAVMGVPTLLFLLPILDTTLVTFTRLLRGQSPVQGGRDHTSHRLIAFGLTERKALLALYSVALVSGLAATLVEGVAYWVGLLVVPLLVIAFALLVAYLGGLKVVSAPAADAIEKPLTRIMLELTFRRRMLEVILDFFLIAVAYYMAFFTRFGFTRGAGSLRLSLQSLPIAFVAVYLSYFLAGVYRGVWRYVGVKDYVSYLMASLGGAALSGFGVYILFLHEKNFSFITYALFAAYLFVLLSVSRSSFKVLDQISVQQNRVGDQPVLLCGAGDNGELALRWILRNPHLEYRPVGFIDSDPYMIGRQIHGVDVLGAPDQLDSILSRRRVIGMILTTDAINPPEIQGQMIEICRQHGCWVRTMRLEFELVE